jgi:hypothetical protein
MQHLLEKPVHRLRTMIVSAVGLFILLVAMPGCDCLAGSNACLGLCDWLFVQGAAAKCSDGTEHGGHYLRSCNRMSRYANNGIFVHCCVMTIYISFSYRDAWYTVIVMMQAN